MLSGETTVQARHITQLRTAINSLRTHLGLAAYSWQYSATTNDLISANPILEMRTALDQALGAPSPAYAAGLAQYQPIKAIHIQELRGRVLTAWNSGTTGTDIRWLISDQLGTPRIILDQSGSLAATTRHDYLPFGEELTAGGRTAPNGYTNSDTTRQKFTGYERDDETGLDFAQARYYSKVQGRFTSVDPLMASARTANPQTFNRYACTLNNPLRNVDPTGLVDQDSPDYKPEFRPCTVGADAGCSETNTVLAGVTINISEGCVAPSASAILLPLSFKITNVRLWEAACAFTGSAGSETWRGWERKQIVSS